MKTCIDCRNEKPLAEFASDRAKPDGLCRYCKTCSNQRQYESRVKRGLVAGSYTPRKEPREGFRWCSDCADYIPLEQASASTSYCKAHHNQRGRESRERNGGSKRYHMRRRYGIDLEEYEAKVDAQNGKCAVCKERQPSHIDHDHACCDMKEGACGQCVRGILCFRCNAALGNVGDSVDVLKSMISYLEDWRQQI